jgi:hypothetical protein
MPVSLEWPPAKIQELKKLTTDPVMEKLLRPKTKI